MLTMDQIHDIRNRFYHKGEKISQIAKTLNIDWKTVQKYVDMEDFNPPKPKQASEYRLCPKLEPFKETIDSWLQADKQAPRKQRHTATRVFKRLQESFPKSFDCSYRTVAKYFSIRHKEIFAASSEGYLPLKHHPGSVQVDFGSADFYENGKRHSGKYLELSYPHSNKGYLQLFPGENMECLLEGLVNIFDHINCVPSEIWFDNTKTIVTKILRGGNRELTERFTRFMEHYRFKAVFTNPNKGNEKGNVENKVGYQRRNFLVPVPRFTNLKDYNKELLQKCEEDAQRDHYRHNETIENLFQEDFKNSLPLPSIKFDLSNFKILKTNKWGKFYLNNNLHEYSVSPKFADTYVNIQLTSTVVTVLDENFREIVSHPRFYGKEKQQSMNWMPYLRQLSKRPRALKYSGIYELMPSSMQEFLEKCSPSETGEMLKTIADLTDKTGFESALKTVNQALSFGAKDKDSLINLYRRMYLDIPELPPMKISKEIPDLYQMKTNLLVYDAFLEKEGRINV